MRETAKQRLLTAIFYLKGQYVDVNINIFAISLCPLLSQGGREIINYHHMRYSHYSKERKIQKTGAKKNAENFSVLQFSFNKRCFPSMTVNSNIAWVVFLVNSNKWFYQPLLFKKKE